MQKKAQDFTDSQHNKMTGALHKEAGKLEQDTVQT
jgi:hypothetical protein